MRVDQIDWEAYRQWLENQFSPGHAKDVYNYSRKYAHCLLDRDLSELLMIQKTKRTNKALANLSKFVGMHDEFLKMMHKHDLEWGGKSNEELVIERLTKVQDPNEVFEWIKQVKRARSDLSDFMGFMAITGLRLVEAIESYNLIIKLAKEGKLNEYYNEEKEALEHFRFKEIFLRKSKKAFVSFIPKELIEKQPEIDFIHGRVTTNIFMANYFNPALICDLKERVFNAVKEIQNKIS